MPTKRQSVSPSLHVSILMTERGRHTAVYTWGSIPLTPKRMKLLRQLVGSEEWREQLPQKKVTWETVEELVAKQSQREG